MSNRLLEEARDKARDEKLAEELGITIDELEMLSPVVTDDSSDDGLLYRYVVQFSDTAPTHLLKKIHGLSTTNFVYVDANMFEDGDEGVDRPEDEDPDADDPDYGSDAVARKQR
ncbi:MAG: hypothetical protein ACOH2K_14975 [Burkholderiaceae bacterium]